MKVTSEKIEGCKVELTITIPAADFAKGLDVAFEKVVKNVTMQGFRKGKVPRKMFEKTYGVESLYEEGLNAVLPEFYGKALDAEGIDPVSYPEWDVKEIEKDKDLIVVATVTVKPDVTLGDYKGLKVEALSEDVTDADVTEEIDKLLTERADMVVKEGKVENGDVALIDFEGFKDDVAFEGGKGENHPLEIGSNSFIPGFEEQLIGLVAGDEKDIDVTFPEDYHVDELAGAAVVFKIKLHEVKGRELPTLDDEFVKDLDRDGVETVDALKADINEKLAESKKSAAKNHVIGSVILQAVANATFETPEAMVETEIENMVRNLENQYKSQGLSLEIYLQFSGMTLEALKEQMQPEARKRVEQNLVVEAITKAEAPEVTDEDVNAKFEEMSKQYNMSVEDIKNMIPDPDMIKEDVKISKVIDLMVDSAIVK